MIRLLVPVLVFGCIALTQSWADPAAAQADAGDTPIIRMPTIDNPYCDVPTYARPDVPEQARAMKGADGKAVIHINPSLMRQKAYAGYLLAHECCHHLNNHIDAMREKMARRGEVSFKSLAGVVKEMELEADCCAAKMLMKRGETASIEAAKAAMTKFGGMPTGAYYPSGIERAFTIAKCSK
jgi:hypothetical protein